MFKKILLIALIVLLLGSLLAERVDVIIPVQNHTESDNLGWNESGHYINSGVDFNNYSITNVSDMTVNRNVTVLGWFKGLFNWLITPSSSTYATFNGSSFNLTIDTTKWFYNQTTNSIYYYNQTLPLSSMTYNHTTIANTYTDALNTSVTGRFTLYNASATAWTNSVNASTASWVNNLFMKISSWGSNLALINTSNIFQEQQVFNKGMNITGNVTNDGNLYLNNDSIITRTGVNSSLGISGAGTFIEKLG